MISLGQGAGSFSVREDRVWYWAAVVPAERGMCPSFPETATEELVWNRLPEKYQWP